MINLWNKYIETYAAKNENIKKNIGAFTVMKLSVYYVLAYNLLLFCYLGGSLLSVVVPPLVNDILCNDDKN